MDKDYFIQLANNLYKLTLLFPKKEPLRYKMRELAGEILANPTEKNLEILDSFFEVAKSQNWVSPKEILNLQAEYSKLKGGLKKPENPEPQENYRDRVFVISIDGRQQRILEVLKENGRAQVRELKELFPEVTKRTLRRDFEFLLKQGKIERIGERNETFYQLKG